MTGYLTEQQQIEHFKNWWKENGLSVMVFFLIAIVSGCGWHFWLKHREVKFERGSTHYEELLGAVINNDDPIMLKQANLLRANYANTPYAALATLMMARNDIYQNNYKEAEKKFIWVVQHGASTALQQTARLRLARLYIQTGQPKLALETLQKIDDPAYVSMIDEIKGDSYLALNQIDNARVAYQQAMGAMKGYAAMRPILTMKINDLAKDAGA